MTVKIHKRVFADCNVSNADSIVVAENQKGRWPNYIVDYV